MNRYTLRDAEMKYSYDLPVSSSKSENGYYQTIEFDISALPEIASWQVGEEYTLVIKVKETKHEIIKTGKSAKEKACFEILEVGNLSDGNEEYREKVKEKLK